MPDVSIAELLVEAAAALKAIHDSKDADRETRRAAHESYNDILLLIGRHSVNNYEGRTALLTGLITELAEFNRTVRVKSPIAGAVDNLTAIAEKAADLFRAEKKSVA